MLRAVPFGPICPLTNKELNKDNSAVDHVGDKQFTKLLFDFTKLSGLNPLKIEIRDIEGVIPDIKDKGIKSDWQEYHKDKCVLRLICREENSKLPKTVMPWEELYGN